MHNAMANNTPHVYLGDKVRKIDRSKTPSLLGPLGLNLVPSARFDPVGTVSSTLSTFDPYNHLILGAQISDHVYVGLRQTSQSSGLSSFSDDLTPGLDFKIKLIDENLYRPALALGLQSAFGHKGQAGEYITASKRYGDFDFTAGAAWGRLGSAGHIKNPLGLISNHFTRQRDFDGNNPNNPGDWFTGPDIGFFAGVEYAPYDSDFSLKLDWGADRYIRELASIDGFDSPNPWAVSVDYHPRDWVSANLGLVGGDKILGRITLRNLVDKWPGRKQITSQAPPLYPLSPYIASGHINARAIEQAALDDSIAVNISRNDQSPGIIAHLDVYESSLGSDASSPQQIGRLMRYISHHAEQERQSLHVNLTSQGLKGPQLNLQHRDFYNAIHDANGSPQEIWHNTNIRHDGGHVDHPSLAPARPNIKEFLQYSLYQLEQDISLAEDDSGLITRTSLTQENQISIRPNIFLGLKTRLNLGHNLDNLSQRQSFLALQDQLAGNNNDNANQITRSDVARFADQTVSFDRVYASYLATPYPDIHLGLAAGYLEEIYGGVTGEALYRPFGKTYAIGASLGHVYRRDPDSILHAGFDDTGGVTTGHLKFYYEIPNSHLTLETQIGRYLAGDWGGTLALSHQFKNGSVLRSFITASDEQDRDLFGGDANYYAGLEFSLPLGGSGIFGANNFLSLPERSQLKTRFIPLGRDQGQILDSPINLYQQTEALSYRHLIQNWDEIIR